MPKITDIKAHKMVDSRGFWTIYAKVELDSGHYGVHTIPSGASTGEQEALYLSVEDALFRMKEITENLIGLDVRDQAKIDSTLINLDGTPNKKILGANAILAASLACAKAAANYKKVPLYKHLAELYGNDPEAKLTFPTPVFNILNGGKHATNNLSFQEFMIIPSRDMDFVKSMEAGVEIYHVLRENLLAEGISTGVGDEGGFAPQDFTVDRALRLIKKSVRAAKYDLGREIYLGTDVAAGSFYNKSSGRYEIKEENLVLTSDGLQKYLTKILDEFPFIYVEDMFYERDYDAWQKFKSAYGDLLNVVGDDLVVTNPRILDQAIKSNLLNAVIVKPNQVGTLMETLQFIKTAQDHNFKIIVSHRSGETSEDTFIADLGLAVRADYIKSGAPCRGERLAKYNRLLEVYYETQA